MKYILFFLIIFFIGCSSKINPNEFSPINAPKSKFLPSKNEILYKPQVLIVPFKGYYSNIATSTFKDVLLTIPSIKVIDREFKSIKEEIKLAELAKSSNSNLNQADYIIRGEINSIYKKRIYHPPVFYKDKKGRVHKIRAYYEFRICIDGDVQIIKIPENYILNILNLNDCVYENTYSPYIDYSPLIIKAIKNSIWDKKITLSKIFAKRGYIYEIRKKDDEIILHTTLGSDFGAYKNAHVDIYTIQKTKIPFSKDYKIEITKIGEGLIKIVKNDNSWILVTKKNSTIHIGDFVKMNYKTSFWDIFR